MRRVSSLLERILSLKIERLRRGITYKDRFSYQKEYINFNIKDGEKVLDLGSGHNPFPLATHLVDLYAEDDAHRGGIKLIKDNRPFLIADIEDLPFHDKEFDFCYCSHVLEHANNPVKACKEIMRVAKRGYIETPTRLSDMFYNFLTHHRWHIEKVGNTLIFIEYSERERKGTGSSYFFEQQINPYQNEIKKTVYKNRDIFCNMFMWNDAFEVHVFDKNGKHK